MCDYCGCRSISAIAELTEEHENIAAAAARLSTAIAAQDFTAATTHLATLQRLLPTHTRVEETGLFPLLADLDEFADGIATLYDDHDDIDTALLTATPDWAAVTDALDLLTEHIYREEHGLFPATLRVLTPAQWDQVHAVRDTVRTGHQHHGHDHDHGHDHGHSH